jgi:hypothetical protein
VELEKLWTVLGGRGEIPSRAGKFSGPLLIMGSGRVAVGGGKFETVWDDYRKVMPWKGEIMCVNDVGQHLHDRVRHWVTLHPEYAPGWMAFRKGHLYGSGDTPMWHSHKAKPGVDVVWSTDQLGGTSGLFACFVGLLLGYSEITLAGIPMTGSGHYFDPSWYGSEFADRPSQSVWKWAANNVFEGRVKSLSGWTKELLGEPAWLKAPCCESELTL